MMPDTEKVLDGLERLRFFNQRAGRELWSDKPRKIQEQDIASADEIYANAIELLKEQERKTGSWDYGTQCSVCKGTIIPPKDRKVRVNFCPWCGADMRDSYEQEGR
jgi:hypothetical protein